MTDDCYMRTKAIQKEFEGKYFQSLFLQYTGLEGEKKISWNVCMCMCVCICESKYPVGFSYWRS